MMIPKMSSFKGIKIGQNDLFRIPYVLLVVLRIKVQSFVIFLLEMSHFCHLLIFLN